MEITKGDKLGRQGGGSSQERLRMEITKGDKLGRQGGSSSQEHPRMKIMKHEGRLSWETRRQQQQGAEQNGDHEGRQDGSGTSLGDKAAAAAKTSPEWRSGRATRGDKAAAARPFRDFGDQQPSH